MKGKEKRRGHGSLLPMECAGHRRKRKKKKKKKKKKKGEQRAGREVGAGPAVGWREKEEGSTPAVAIGSQSLTGCLAVRSSVVQTPAL